MTWQSYLAIATFLTLPIALAQAAEAPPEDVVVLVSIEGKAELAPASTDNWMPATNNQVLHLGDRLRTDKSSRAIIRFSKWGQLRVREASLFTIEPPREPGRRPLLNLLKGFFYFFNRDKAIELDLQNRLASAATRGTEFQVAVAEDGRMEVSVLEGEVELRNSLGPVTLSSGQQGVALPGQHPTRTAVIAALNVIQWCLYYPAVLDVDELGLSEAERSALRESLAAWRSGDLVKALQSYPQNRQPVSERERVYRAALLLVVGEIAQAESLLPSVDTPFSNALRELIAAVQFQTYHRAAPPVLATEWLAESYYRQSRAGVDKRMLEDALKAAEAAVDVAPNSGLAWERLAELEFSFGRTGKTLVALDNAIRLSPRNAQALALKGFLLSAQNKIPQALEYFDQAIAADGALANAWLGRGLCRIRQGNAAAGREDLLVAAALEPERAVLRSYLGKAFSDTGDDPRARKELELARTLDPKDPTSWLYSALDHEQHNRINEAIRDLEQSKELNDNRSLYRSDLLLDQDRAVRSANLARIYQEAGMVDLSVREAARAVNEDYANYSAHLFLANSYNALRDPNQINLRYETPTYAEYLVGNLLAPVNAGILSPTVSQQEYSPLLERNRLGLTSTTEYLSRGAWTQSGAQFGVFDKTSYSLEGYYRSDDGMRPNNDVEQAQVSLQLKQQLTPQDTVFAMALAYSANGGDLFQYYNQTNANPSLRTEETQQPLLALGYHHEWGPGSHTLFLAGRLQDTYKVTNPDAGSLVLGETAGTIEGVDSVALHQNYRSDLVIYSAELQQLWEHGRNQFIVGARYQQGQFETQEQLNLQTFSFYFPDPPVTVSDQSFANSMERVSGYGYYLWQALDSVELVGGVSYDWLTFPLNFRSTPVASGQQSEDQFCPKAGFIWTPFGKTTVRGDFTRSLSGASLEESFQLEPSQVAGFNQLYRSLIPESVAGANAGASIETWNLSLEQKIGHSTYLGASGTILYSKVSRQTGVFISDVDVSDFAFSGTTPEQLNFRERSLLITADQLVGRDFAFGARYRLTDAKLSDSFTAFPTSGVNLNGFNPNSQVGSLLNQLELHANFNHSSGFFSEFQAVWYAQSNSGYSPDLPGDDFWQFNLFAGYRSPQRRVEVTVGLLNLTGRDYKLNPLTVYNELSRERTFVVRLNLSL